MNQRLLELATRRGELMAHIAVQRANIAAHTTPFEQMLGRADRIVAGASWLKKRPQLIIAFFVGLALVRPRRVWRWGKRAFFLWRSWKALRSRID